MTNSGLEKLQAKEGCRLIELPKFDDVRGALSFVEGNHHIPFEIKRIYYLYDVPNAALRGGHAHKNLYQLILALHGCFDVAIDNGRETVTYHLDKPNKGLLVVPGLWRDLKKFTNEAVALVLASEYYDEKDYIRDYDEYVKWVKQDR